jgi:hypothetical protein
MRRLRHHAQKTANHGELTDMVSIRERPAEVAAFRPIPIAQAEIRPISAEIKAYLAD